MLLSSSGFLGFIKRSLFFLLVPLVALVVPEEPLAASWDFISSRHPSVHGVTYAVRGVRGHYCITVLARHVILPLLVNSLHQKVGRNVVCLEIMEGIFSLPFFAKIPPRRRSIQWRLPVSFWEGCSFRSFRALPASFGKTCRPRRRNKV